MLTTIEVAEQLGVTPRTIQRHIKAEHLKAKRYGRDFLITQEDVDRFKRERRTVGRPKKIRPLS